MSADPPRQWSFFAELRRRNVLRAALLYAGVVWAAAQGIAQLAPALGLPGWATRAFLIAAAAGFPFWLVFAWVYEFTPQGIKRESEVAPGESITHRTGRKLDFAIIAVLAVAVLLLLGNQLLWHKGISQGPATVAQITANIPQKSVAVLPFVNESGDKAQQYFSDGLSEDLITALSQFAGLKVISRDSAFQFRDPDTPVTRVGKLLGVAHVLEGSVRRSGGDVRITATLVNTADGSIVWSQHYDKPYKDLFALQDTITHAVADALQARLLTAPGAVVQSDRPPGGNLDAYAAYQRGGTYMHLGTKEGMQQAIAAFGEAIKLDPKYAAAYALSSEAWTLLSIQYLQDPTQIAQARNAARAASARAVQIDPDSSLAHWVHGNLLLDVDLDRIGAEAEFERALQLAPNDPTAQFGLGFVVGSNGQVRRAEGLIRRALANNPRQANWYAFLSIYLTALGKPDAAQQAIDSAIELKPGSSAFHEQRAVNAIVRGDAKAALVAARQEPAGPWRDIALALALQVGPDRAAADAALAQLIKAYRDTGPYQIAQVYALRHDPDGMFKWLDHAWAVRDSGVRNVLFDPIILRYRGDPRFAAFCTKIGVPTTTDAVAIK